MKAGVAPAVRFVWALPWTLFGLCFLPFAAPWTNGRVRWVAGVFELHGRGIDWCLRHLTLLPGGAAAITFGNTVLGRDAEALESTRSHERVHVRQYGRWGLFFVPAYVIASAWLKLRGRDAYRENPFEVEAYAKEDCG